MEYGAIDLHKRRSQIRIVEEDGAIVLERKIDTTRADLESHVRRAARRMRILIESSTESEWVAPASRGAGSRGDRGGSELRADVRVAVAQSKNGQTRCRRRSPRRVARGSIGARIGRRRPRAICAGSCGCGVIWCDSAVASSLCCDRCCARRGSGSRVGRPNGC